MSIENETGTMALKKIEKTCQRIFGSKHDSIQASFLLEALEPRLLLSADPVGLSAGGDLFYDDKDIPLQDVDDPEVVESLIASLAPQPKSNDVVSAYLSENLPRSLDLESLSHLAVAGQESASIDGRSGIYIAPPPLALLTDTGDEPLLAPDAETSMRHEILFIDSRTPDYLELLDDIQKRDGNIAYEIFILDSGRDGIEQVSDVLAQYDQIDAVHFISHGTNGAVQLGSNWLSQENLAAYSSAIERWGSALSNQADLLFYGCDLAGTAEGVSLIQSLSQLSGADVAASNDLTGNAALAGDWLLEYQAGEIETNIAFSESLQQSWSGTLAIAQFQEGSGTYSGTLDTKLDSAASTTKYYNDTELDVDSSAAIQGLIGFDNIFGASTGQIPWGSTINSVELIFEVSGASVAGANVELHQMLASWDQDSTWDSMVGGIQLDNIEANLVADSTLVTPTATGQQSFMGKTTTVQAWSDGDANNGWAITNSNTNPWKFYSADEGTVNFRPLLQVDYTVNTPDSSNPLWLSTDNHVSSGGQPGTEDWRKADLVQIAGPNLGFEQAGITDGTFGMAFDGDFFAPSKNVVGSHYVSADIQVGASNFQLKAGDLLLISDSTNWIGNSAAPDPGFSNALASVDKQKDVVVFRPDIVGDYSVGSFALLLDNPAGADLMGITLIEQDTKVGDANLQAGDFLFSRSGGAEDEDIWLYQTTDVGTGTTSGSASVLIEGTDVNVNIDKVNGIDLVETNTTIGGQTLSAGTILLTSDANVAGSNALAIEKFDVYALNVTKTTLVSGLGNGIATASLVFDGSDVGFEAGAEKLDGFTLTVSNNQAPVVTTTLATPLNYTILDPATVIDPFASVADVDSTNLDGGAFTISISSGVTVNDTLSIKPGGNVTLSGSDVLVSGTTIGAIDAVNDGVNGADLVINWNSNSTPATIEEVLRQVAYINTSGTPDTSTRIVDFVLTDGDGGTSELAQQTINFAGVAAPIITMPGATVTFNEGDVTPVIIDPGATVSDADSANFDTGTLTVTITNNGSVNDVLSILPGGNVTLSGSDVLVSATVIGTIDAINDGTAGNPLVITWNVNSTPATVQEVVRQIAFDNSSENPSGLTRTVGFILSDGDGGTSLAGKQQVDVNPVNDAPSGSDKTIGTAEETGYTFAAADFGFSDAVDNDNFNAVKISTLPALGTLTNNAVAVNAGDFISLSDIDLGLLVYTPPLNGVGTAYASFDFQAQDTGGTANGGVDLSGVNTITIDVSNIDDAPGGSVTISGTITEDQVLTASNTLTDGDGLGVISYQWQRDGVNIGGATASTYTLGDADVGAAITVVASYTDGQGKAEAVSSAATAAVANINDVPTGGVTIAGTVAEDQILTASNTLADADGLGAISYQWQRDGVDIGGATANTYTLGDADVGAAITVVASYTDGYDTVESVISAATAVVSNVNDTPTGTVTISGTATEDQILTASNTLADADGLGAISYQWQRDAVDIGGATASAYALGDADVGSTITVVAKYTDGQGTTESVSSAATGVVTNVNDAPTTITPGTVIVDENTDTTEGLTVATLTAVDADDGDGASYTIQGGVDAARFSLINGNELVLTDGMLDFETQGSYEVVVRVTDADGLSHDETITITVNDVLEAPLPKPTIPVPIVIAAEPVTAKIIEEEESVSEPEEVVDESAEEPEAVVEVVAEAEQQAVSNLPVDSSQQVLSQSFGNDSPTANKPNIPLKASVMAVMKAIQVAQPGLDGLLAGEFSDPMSLIEIGGFSRDLDQLREDVTTDIQYGKIMAGSTVAASTGLSIGYVAYLLRGGVVLSSVLTSLPAWTFFDPTPVLGGVTKGRPGEDGEDDESLESMVNKSEQKSKSDEAAKHE